MRQSPCGNWYRHWSANPTSATLGHLRSCLGRQSRYYGSVHPLEVSSAPPLPPGPSPSPATDWSSLADDAPTGCGMCIFMRGSPCGNHFRSWNACVEANSDADPSGEPKYLSACKAESLRMFECNADPKFKAWMSLDSSLSDASKARESSRPDRFFRRSSYVRAVRYAGLASSGGGGLAVRDDPNLVPYAVIDFGDEVRVNLRGVLSSLSYEEAEHGSWSRPAGPPEGEDDISFAYVTDAATGELLGAADVGVSVNDSWDLCCKRSGGVLRARVPEGGDDVVVCLVGKERIYRTRKTIVPWDKEEGKGEEEGGVKDGGDKEGGDKEEGGKEEGEDEKVRDGRTRPRRRTVNNTRPLPTAHTSFCGPPRPNFLVVSLAHVQAK